MSNEFSDKSNATPRTEALRAKQEKDRWHDIAAVWEHARQLERELAAAEAAMDEWESAGGDAPHRTVNLATRIRVQAHFVPSSTASSVRDQRRIATRIAEIFVGPCFSQSHVDKVLALLGELTMPSATASIRVPRDQLIEWALWLKGRREVAGQVSMDSIETAILDLLNAPNDIKQPSQEPR